MKKKYEEWTCIGCGKVSRFTGRHIFLDLPYWFTIRTEGCRSSSERPSFDTCACSTACLEKAGNKIDLAIYGGNYSIPNKKSIEATICDQCGKVATSDERNPVYGPGPLRDWDFVKTSAGRKDFCSEECKKNHTLHPEDSVFAGLEFDNPWDEKRLIKAINAPDFREAIRKATPIEAVFHPSLKDAIDAINRDSEEQQKSPPENSNLIVVPEAKRLPKHVLEKFLGACNESQADVGQELRDDIERTGM